MAPDRFPRPHANGLGHLIARCADCSPFSVDIYFVDVDWSVLHREQQRRYFQGQNLEATELGCGDLFIGSAMGLVQSNAPCRDLANTTGDVQPRLVAIWPRSDGSFVSWQALKAVEGGSLDVGRPQ